MEILNHLNPLLRAFWFVAISSSLIFIIQTIMTFIGVDSSDGIDADFDGNFDGNQAPFQLFSFRNLINFLLGFSWSGIAFYNSISSSAFLLIISIIVGSLFVYMFFIIIQQIQKLAEDNTFQVMDTMNKSAEVYIPIPGELKGKGKVLISVKGSTHELEAVTEQDRLESGVMVKVVKVESQSLLVVERI